MKTPTFQTEAQKTFCQTFQKLCSHTSAWQAWSDFIQLAAISLSNCCDMQAKREKQHNEIMQQYDRAERSIFAELFEQTVMALEEQSEQDFLGDMFMQLNLGSHWHGQFFTPYSVCRLMSSITIQSAVEQVSEHGYCKVNDGACGAGATLIAARNSLQSAGIGTDQVLFVGQDIDRTAALMCYIQLSLLGCAGYVVIADTLSNPAVGGGDHSTSERRAGHMVYAGTVFVRCMVRTDTMGDDDVQLMTINQAIHILDSETTAEALGEIEYYGGLHGREKIVAACDEACRVAASIMRKYQEEHNDID